MFLLLIILYVLDMWKKKKKLESIYLYFCTDERHGPKTLPVLCLHTNNKQRGEVFILWPWLTPQTGEEPLLHSVCTPVWGSHHTAHWGETSSLPTHTFRSQQSREHRKYNYMTKDIVPNTFELWIVSEHLGFFFLYCVTERGIVNRQILCSNLCSIYKYCI